VGIVSLFGAFSLSHTLKISERGFGLVFFIPTPVLLIVMAGAIDFSYFPAEKTKKKQGINTQGTFLKITRIKMISNTRTCAQN